MRAQDSGPRTGRLEARVSLELKRLFQRAADLQGVTLSDFLIGSARQVALQTLQEHELIQLNQRDTASFVAALLEPPPPGRRLRAAARRFKSVQPGDVFQVLDDGNGKLSLQRLKSDKPKPLVSVNPLRAEDFRGIDLDAPIQEWDKR